MTDFPRSVPTYEPVPPLTLGEKVLLVVCALVLFGAGWVCLGAIDSVGSDAPPAAEVGE